jgi:hypothetical protein
MEEPEPVPDQFQLESSRSGIFLIFSLTSKLLYNIGIIVMYDISLSSRFGNFLIGKCLFMT